MTKRDLKNELKHLYHASAKDAVLIEVPTMNFLMIDGQGDPNTSPSYGEAIEALFAVAYAIKFMIKKGPTAVDYGVMPLEGLWWVDDMSTFSVQDKSNVGGTGSVKAYPTRLRYRDACITPAARSP